jgi:pimeloyl-ACP methyl ester carboxylesterase
MGGMRFHYLDWGTAGKTPIVFLHGGYLTAHTWDVVCAALRDSYHCLALDQRGHGDSDWSTALDYTTEAYVGDLVGFIDHRKLDDFILVGMSLGGLNSIAYAGSNARRLKALVIVDIGPKLNPQGAQDINAFANTDSELPSVEHFVERALKFNPRRDPELLRRSLMFNLRRLPDGNWTWKYDRRHRQGWDIEKRRAERARLWGVVPGITCPTLLVRGENSPVFYDEDAEEFAAALPDGRWVRVPNAGHTVQGDNPRDLTIEMRRFFNEVGAL